MKIISFCLWGDDPKYTTGAIKNAELALKIYPKWICRYYLGTTTPISVIKKLKSFNNTQIIQMEQPGDWRSTFWRFYPASENDVDIVISRDTDSRLSLREKAAVDEWLASKKSFHVMRDHPDHGILILAGTCGIRGNLLLSMKQLINNWEKSNENYYQVEQHFLCKVIYPLVKNDIFIHDEIYDNKPFPVIRKNYEFVGQVFDKNDNPVQKHIQDLKKYLDKNISLVQDIDNNDLNVYYKSEFDFNIGELSNDKAMLLRKVKFYIKNGKQRLAVGILKREFKDIFDIKLLIDKINN